LTSLLVSNISNLEDAIAWEELIIGLSVFVGPAVGGFLYTLEGFKWTFLTFAAFSAAGMAVFLISLIYHRDTWKRFENHHEEETHERLTWREILNPVLILGVASGALITIVLGFTGPTTEPHLRRVGNLSPGSIGSFLGFRSVLYSASALLAGTIASKIGRKKTMIIGFMITALGLALQGPTPSFLESKITSRSVSISINAISFALIGFGPGLALIPLLPFMKANLSGNEDEIGSLVSSAFQLSTSLGEFLGPVIGGFMVTRMPQTRELTCKESESSIGCTSGYNSSMLLFGLLCLAWSFLLMIGLAPDTPLKQTETYLVIEGEDQEKDETRYQSTDLTSSSAPAVSTPESLKRVIRS